MSDQTYAYPFDPTGEAPSNKIPPEMHAISPPDYMDHYFIVPKVGPFFERGLVVTHHPSGLVLENGKDYVLGHKFASASKATGKSVWGSISFYDKTLAGGIEISYQTIGGMWTIDLPQVAQILADRVNNPRITTWEQVVDLPINFPVIDHEWNLADLVGASDLVDALDRVSASILDGGEGGTGGGGVGTHVLDLDNPHKVNKSHVGLGLTPNLPLARSEHLRDPDSVDALVSPKGVRDILALTIDQTHQAHLDDHENPHQVEARHLNLENVENLPLATEAIAIAGESNLHYLTPITALAMVNDQFTKNAAAHSGNKENPHEVTAEQINLGNVANLPLADPETAKTGTSNLHYLTPNSGAILLEELVGKKLDTFIARTDNPHGLTKDQIDLADVVNLGIASAVDIIDLSGVGYITIDGLKTFFDSKVQATIDHLSDTDNPHGVTATQVGLGSLVNAGMIHTPDVDNHNLENVYVSPKYITSYADAKAAEVTAAYIAAIANNKPAESGNADKLEGLDVSQIVDLVAVSTVTAIEASEARDAVLLQAEVDKIETTQQSFLTETEIVDGFNEISIELDLHAWELQGNNQFTLNTVTLSTFAPVDIVDLIYIVGIPVYLLADKVISHDLTSDIFESPIPVGPNFVKLVGTLDTLIIQDDANSAQFSIDSGVTWRTGLGALDSPIVNAFTDANILTVFTAQSVYVYDTDTDTLTPRIDFFTDSITDVDVYGLGYLAASGNNLVFADLVNLTTTNAITVAPELTILSSFADATHIYISVSDNTIMKVLRTGLDVESTSAIGVSGKFVEGPYKILYNTNKIGVSYIQDNVWSVDEYLTEDIVKVITDGATSVILTSTNLYYTV